MEYEIDTESLKDFNAQSILINKENKKRLKCHSFDAKLHTYNWLEDFPEMELKSKRVPDLSIESFL